MDGWMDGWIDGSMDRWIDGSMDRWIDGSMDPCGVVIVSVISPLFHFD